MYKSGPALLGQIQLFPTLYFVSLMGIY